jgi:predicted aldo/keto reductase-like oxidoreductase
MLYRKLGRTDLKVSVIGVGGGAFRGTDKSINRVREVIKVAVEEGINFIETAEDYDETKIGPIIKDLKEEVILASKSFSSNEKDMEVSLKNSFERLETDYIDIYMIHTITDKESLEYRIKNGVLDVLKKAKTEGKIGFIGLTGHRIPTLIDAIKTNEFDVVEIPYCIGSFAPEKVFKMAKEYDVGIITMRPLGGGILINLNKEFEKANSMNIANALAYVLSNKDVSTTLVGMSKIEHVKEVIEAVNNISITKNKRKKMEEEVKKFLSPNFCRGCLACMPCEEYGWRFNIDNFLRMEIFYLKYGMKNVVKEYRKLDMKADVCTKCGKCELKCPYNVPIIKKLESLHKTFML